MARNSKNLKAAYKAIDRSKAYGLAEAVALVKGNAKAKFDETIEIAMNLGVDPRHACLLYTSPSPRDGLLSRMPSSA